MGRLGTAMKGINEFHDMSIEISQVEMQGERMMKKKAQNRPPMNCGTVSKSITYE